MSGIIKSIDCGTKVKNMIKEVIHDPILLAMKSEKATIEDLQVAEDLFVSFPPMMLQRMVASQVSGNAV